MHWMIKKLYDNFQINNTNVCLHIEDKSFSYSDIHKRIATIQSLISENTSEDIVGVVSENSPDTYASILACWFSGKGFVPLHPGYPLERNEKIINQANINLVLTSGNDWESYLPDNHNITILQTIQNKTQNKHVITNEFSPEKIFCILFTSGSTGQPKGVPYSLKNIASTLDAFLSLGYKLSEKDRFPQM